MLTNWNSDLRIRWVNSFCWRDNEEDIGTQIVCPCREGSGWCNSNENL